MDYVLLALILLGWVLNNLSKKYVLHKVTYQRKISRAVVEIGEEFEITTIVENKKLLPVTFLQVTGKFPAMLVYKLKADIMASVQYVFHKTTLLLKPYERVSRSYTVVATKRGKYLFKEVTLTSGDLLGLDTSSQELQFAQELVVLPRSLVLMKSIQPYGDYYGDISVQRWIIDDPIILTGVREYSGVEPQKTIHWPSSLKSGHLMVKKFDYTTDNSVMIILNIEVAKPFWFHIDEDKIETCISLARGVMDELEGAGIPYGLTTDAHISGFPGSLNIQEPGLGTYHYAEVVEILARIINSICLSFEDLLQNFIRFGRNYSTFVVITPTVLDSYIDLLNYLSEQSVKIVLISLNRYNLDCLDDRILKYCAEVDSNIVV